MTLVNKQQPTQTFHIISNGWILPSHKVMYDQSNLNYNVRTNKNKYTFLDLENKNIKTSTSEKNPKQFKITIITNL